MREKVLKNIYFIYICTTLNHFAIHLKITHDQSTIFQLLKNALPAQRGTFFIHAKVLCRLEVLTVGSCLDSHGGWRTQREQVELWLFLSSLIQFSRV